MERPDKAAALSALRANGGAIRKTARQLGIPESTLRGWAREGVRATKKPAPTDEELAVQLRELAHRLAGELLRPEKLSKASAKDLAIALGIALDKLGNLTGGGFGEDGQLMALVSAIREARP